MVHQILVISVFENFSFNEGSLYRTDIHGSVNGCESYHEGNMIAV